jgi:hypothetical protein
VVEQLTEGGRYVVRLVSLNGDLTVARGEKKGGGET